MRESLPPAKERIYERAAQIPCSGVNDHPGRLVHRKNIVVFVDHIERDRLGLGVRRRGSVGCDPAEGLSLSSSSTQTTAAETRGSSAS